MVEFKGFRLVITICVSTQQGSDLILSGVESILVYRLLLLICKLAWHSFPKILLSHQS
jgi:hypothetical protein